MRSFEHFWLIIALDAQADCLTAVRAGQGESIRDVSRLYCIIY